MKKSTRSVLSCIFYTIVICILSFAVVISSIGIYTEITTPKLVTGEIVAQNLAKRFNSGPYQIDSLVKRKIITKDEYKVLDSDSIVTRQLIWRVILPAYKIYPYPASIYPNLPFPTTADTPAEQPYLDARAAAVICGLTTPTTDPKDGMTEKEFDTLIAQLEKNAISLPPYTSNCPYLHHQNWTAETYRGRNSLIIGWELIPESWRKDFIAQNWSINFTLPPVIQSETSGSYRHQTAGLTNFKDRLICINTNNPDTTIHEFAHYAAYRVNWLYNEKFEANYEIEASVVAHLLGDYSQTTPREYFAEFVSYWILHPESQPKLQKLAPNTAVWVQEIISNFASLVPSDRVP